MTETQYRELAALHRERAEEMRCVRSHRISDIADAEDAAEWHERWAREFDAIADEEAAAR